MPLRVIQDLGDDKVQAELLPLIQGWYNELRRILPNLPVDLQIYFFEQGSPNIMEESGVGGYAYSSEIMSLGWDLQFPDKVEQKKQLRSTVYHEGLHISQNYTGASEKMPLLHNAIYEGLATVFEREVLGMSQPYGNYSDVTESELKSWIRAIAELGRDYTDEQYSNWAFKDPSTSEKWRLYRAGTWMIDKILENNPNITLYDLITKTAEEIVRLRKTI